MNHKTIGIVLFIAMMLIAVTMVVAVQSSSTDIRSKAAEPTENRYFRKIPVPTSFRRFFPSPTPVMKKKMMESMHKVGPSATPQARLYNIVTTVKPTPTRRPNSTPKPM